MTKQKLKELELLAQWLIMAQMKPHDSYYLCGTSAMWP